MQFWDYFRHEESTIVFNIGLTYHFSKMKNQLWLSLTEGFFGMRKARVVSSFQHILDPEFGGYSASVLIVYYFRKLGGIRWSRQFSTSIFRS